jgi:hypothetical protein
MIIDDDGHSLRMTIFPRASTERDYRGRMVTWPKEAIDEDGNSLRVSTFFILGLLLNGVRCGRMVTWPKEQWALGSQNVTLEA